MAHGAASEMSLAKLGTNSMKNPPTIAPPIVAIPPTAEPIRNDSDRKRVKLSGGDKADHDCGKRSGDPGEQRARAEGQRLVAGGINAHGGGRDRVIADGNEGAAGAAIEQVCGDADRHQKNHQNEQIQPPIAVNAEFRRRHRLDQNEALLAAGPDIEIFQQLRHGDRHRQGDERKIGPLEAQRRQAEQYAERETDQRRRRQRRPIGHAVAMHQNGGGVGARGEKTAVAQRNLPVIAGENVKSEHGDGVDHHLRQLEDVIIADRERQHHRDRDQCGGADPAPHGNGHSGLALHRELCSPRRGEALSAILTPAVPPRCRTNRSAGTQVQ